MTTTQTDPRSPLLPLLGRDTVIHLASDLAVSCLPVDASFWNHAGNPAAELTEGRILCVSDYTDTWTWWECHPVGDELVYLISGDADFQLHDEHGHRSVTLAPGRAAIVPAGTWHRAVVRAPSRMLFVTPTPARTLLRPITADETAA